MGKKKSYDEASVIRMISRKCSFNYASKTIEVNPDNLPGIHTWGKIDYLCHYCGWHWVKRANVYPNKKIEVKFNDADNNVKLQNKTTTSKTRKK